MEESYVMLKPGRTASEPLASEIMERLTRETGAKIIAKGEFYLTPELVDEHYAHIVGRSFYPEMREYMLSGPVVGFVLEGADGLVSRIRESIGATNCSTVGSIRYDYIENREFITANVIHASGSVDEAHDEIKRFDKFLEEVE
ncbi:MAG: nucleoside-diphosphate kinase [Christensenellaceae bacterium]|jgi:nucleoside-diphosphate kinase|nr:nucleoside-diphosphate kinase [Christensenellaceae bacterium]